MRNWPRLPEIAHCPPRQRTLIVLLLACFAGRLPAARLPIHIYTTSDGLPASSVTCIVPDTQGFLWMCSADGFLRFDGYTFVTYGERDGLPDRMVTAFLQTRGGEYWIGTLRGVARFFPEAVGSKAPVYTPYSLPGPDAGQNVTSLVEDRDGVIWCGTRDGLYRKRPGGVFEAVDIGLHSTGWQPRFIAALALDPDDTLWVGTIEGGIYRRTREGRMERDQEAPCRSAFAFAVHPPDRIWAASSDGVCLFTRAPGRPRFAFDRKYSSGLPNSRVHCLRVFADGRLWAGTEAGIGVLASGAEVFTPLGEAGGPEAVDTRAIGIDAAGNIWAASNVYLIRIARAGFVTYTTSDGLGANGVTSIFEDRSGHVCFVNGINTITLNRFDGRRFHPVRPRLVRGGHPIRYAGWGIRQTVLQDRGGDWWIATGEGLFRFRGVRRFEDLATATPAAVYSHLDGLPGDDVFRIFEDSGGDIWIATVDTPGLSRWRRNDGKFERITAADGFRAQDPAASFAEDHAGDLWVGLFWKGLARYRQGRWQMFLNEKGAPFGTLSVMVDHRGRLWISSTNSGLLRVDDPSAAQPQFVSYTTEQGLSSNLLWALAEDRHGRICIGGERGVDVLDPDTGHVSHLSTADGLAVGDALAMFRDGEGNIWYGATLGLSRLLSPPESEPSAPPVRLTALRVAGQPRPISALGALSLSGLEMEASQNRLDVEFASFNFATFAPILYQYRLRPAAAAWNDLGEARAVHLDGLAPGSYDFEVRAIREGLASTSPAHIAFKILPPWWRRWWSIALFAAVLSGLLATAYRLRVSQLVEMERVRTRIAMDLHDDIGASLAQIAILSEVARQQSAGGRLSVTEPLTRVAAISRELTSSLGDIVWAINPRRDRLGDLVQRMRRFGGDLLHARDIDFECVAPAPLADTALSADLRRQVFLVFKECMHNIARHSGAARATAELTCRDGRLRLEIDDDGHGFDPQAVDGNGLASMRKRAELIRGRLQVISAPGQGAKILLEVPLPRRYPFRW